jgi:chromosome segregation ATPase
MREDYEEKGFNPLKLGLIGALIVAGIIAVLLQFGATSGDEGTPQQNSDALASQKLQQFQVQNKELKEKVAELEEVNKVSGDAFEKQLKQKDAQLANLKREISSGNRDTDSKLAWLRKERTQLEAQLSQLKQQLESKSGEAKESVDTLAQLQTELRNTRFELERQERNGKVLKDKLDRISDGDASAADVMVQQLADARQELKRERALRQKLEEEVDDLREQLSPPPQQQ